MRRLLLLSLAGLVLAGASTSVAANRMQAAPRLAVSSSQFGKILFDGRRRAIYAFTRDGRGKSTCYGAMRLRLAAVRRARASRSRARASARR